MELLTLIPSMISLLLAGANVTFFCVMKFNDMAHLAKTSDEIKEMIKDIARDTRGIGERVAALEGKCKANHKV